MICSSLNRFRFIVSSPFQSTGNLTRAVGLFSGDRSHIRLISLSGGQQRSVTVKGSPWLSSLEWTADGTGFFAADASWRKETLLHIDATGKTDVLWEQPAS